MEAVMTSAVPRPRASKNQKFANDGSLESVEALLYRLAMKCHTRVMAMGLGMDFDDVLQEMRMSYVKAKKTWNPQGGSLFSTYCQTACMNNFNRAIEKMERERGLLLIGTESEFTGGDNAFGDGEESGSFMESQIAPESERPEARLESSQELMHNVRGLSDGARRLVVALLDNQRRINGDGTVVMDAKLRDLAKVAGLSGDELRQVKQEILKKFGVSWT